MGLVVRLVLVGLVLAVLVGEVAWVLAVLVLGAGRIVEKTPRWHAWNFP